MVHIEQFKKIIAYLHSINKLYPQHLYAVGGCVRDYVLKETYINDIDLVVDIENGGINFAKYLYENDLLISEPVIYERFGTACFTLKSFPTIPLEIVHTRKEVYPDETSRNPVQSFAPLYVDAERRDLTINALYIKVTVGDIKIIDPTTKGLEDLKNRVIRTPTNPLTTFKEDPLRILRVLRFSARFNMSIEKNTEESLLGQCYRLKHIAKERICDEILKIIASSYRHKIREPFIAILSELFSRNLDTTYYIHNKKLNKIYTKDDNNSHITDLLQPIDYFTMLLYYNSVEKVQCVLKETKFSNKFIDRVCTSLKTLQYYTGYNAHELSDFDIREMAYITINNQNNKDYTGFFKLYTMIWANRHDEMYIKETLFYDYIIRFTNYKLPVNGNDLIKTFKECKNNGKFIEYYKKQLYNYIFCTGELVKTKKKCYEIIRQFKTNMV